MTEVIDLSLDDEIGTTNTMRLWVPYCISPKPSVSYGPGRGNRMKGWFRAYINNDVKQKMNQLRLLVKTAAERNGFNKFPRNAAVTMTVWCYLRRPDTDFVSRRRAANNLKQSAMTTANTMVPVKPDVDNLAKFLLDALSTVLYEDDAQVVDLHIIKLRDSEGLCNGRVAIEVEPTSTPRMPQF